MRLFALIGFPLKHSFSKKYFTEKFEKENIENCTYELLEIPSASGFPKLITEHPDLVGVNVTIPHKQAIVPYLTALDPASAGRIGAVNCIKILPDGQLIGYNTDYYGFKTSLEDWFTKLSIVPYSIKALVLGNGGAAKAVFAALEDLKVEYKIVSRTKSSDNLVYEDLNKQVLNDYKLIINTSPVGTFPNDHECPEIPYQLLTNNHFLYDLVYNPAETLFLRRGLEQGTNIHNGLEMLYLQAEKAWEIWNTKSVS